MENTEVESRLRETNPEYDMAKWLFKNNLGVDIHKSSFWDDEQIERRYLHPLLNVDSRDYQVFRSLLKNSDDLVYEMYVDHINKKYGYRDFRDNHKEVSA